MKLAPLALLVCSAVVVAQTAKKQVSTSESLPATSERKGAWDGAFWGGGGHTVSGGVQGVGIANAGVRIGKILTEQHGSGWYRGNLEYAVDLIPVTILTGVPDRPNPAVLCLITMPNCNRRTSNVYGAGFNPFIVKWNFTAGRRISPYFELGGGLLFTNKDIPFGSSSVNFTPQATLGVNLFTRGWQAISFDLHYEHISNAGLASPNPGFNTVQGRIGYHWFSLVRTH